MFTKKKEKAYNDKIAVLQHKIEELTEIIKTQELIKLRQENAYYKDREKSLSHISFKLKDVAFLEEENCILVKYEPMFAKVFIGDNGKILPNDFFIAVNKLRLLSLEDMKKISVVINNVKKGN
jgi:uncharacterized membrane protein (DUF106 family)